MKKGKELLTQNEKAEKKDKREDECWYNNSAEKKKSRWVEAPGGELFSDSFLDRTHFNSIRHK